MTKTYSLWLTSILLLVIITACRQTAVDIETSTQATIESAVAATDAAQVASQATIDAAVEATTAAQAEAAPTSAESTPADSQSAQSAQSAIEEQTPVDVAGQASPMPLVTPVSVEETLTMSEAELAALINEAVTAATLAAEQSATAAASAATDDIITPDEAQTVEVYFTGTDEMIAYADELISTYATLYGDLAAEAVEELQEIENSLQAIEESTAAINASLDEINEAVEQGLELAEETIAQVEDAAQAAGEQVTTLQQQAQAWTTTHQASLDSRSATAVAIPANQTNSDPKAAIQEALNFFNTGQEALVDGQISTAELTNIAQQGANASASLDASGLPALQSLSGKVSEITTGFAQGDATAAESGLVDFANLLDAIPDVGNLSIEKPTLPERDGISLPENPVRPSR